jgi:hypothetical protein
MLERSREETQQENATRECNKRMQQENATRDSKCIKGLQENNHQ